MRRRYCVVAVVTCLLLAACSRFTADRPVEADLDLPLQTLSGEQINLSDYSGKVILVNFWATWCGPCRVEMPVLDAFYQDNRENGLVLLAINAGESANRARDYIENGGYIFPVMLDLDGSVANHFGGVRGMPTSFVIDSNGEIAYQHIGQLDRKILDEQVLPLLP